MFLVSKVLPSNASRKGTIAACERSLRRLRTDRLDLYLLHWRGDLPLAQTIGAFVELQRAGRIRSFGVSNLDLGDMEELWQIEEARQVQTNQLLYNLSRRGIESDLQPWLRQHRIPVMAYSPMEQSRLLEDPRLIGFARRNGMAPSQAALSWLLAQDDIMVIPKTGNCARLRENLGALDHPLTPSQVSELDGLFPRPSSPLALEML